MNESILREKTYAFALKIVSTSNQISAGHKEFILSKQLLRSGTAPGALMREAEFAQSRPDFISKLSIALKEANECSYWLSLLKDSDIITQEDFVDLDSDIKEIVRLLVSSIKTLKSKN